MGGPMQPLKAAKTTLACAHLHNLCVRQGIPLLFDVHHDALTWSPPVQRLTVVVPTTTHSSSATGHTSLIIKIKAIIGYIHAEL